MLLPMTAVGPLKVETKPILMDFCWAVAETAHEQHGGARRQ